MITINSTNYIINNLQDIARLIREEFNYEVADKLCEIIEENEEKVNKYLDRIDELKDEIEYWSDLVKEQNY